MGVTHVIDRVSDTESAVLQGPLASPAPSEGSGHGFFQTAWAETPLVRSYLKKSGPLERPPDTVFSDSVGGILKSGGSTR